MKLEPAGNARGWRVVAGESTCPVCGAPSIWFAVDERHHHRDGSSSAECWRVAEGRVAS